MLDGLLAGARAGKRGAGAAGRCRDRQDGAAGVRDRVGVGPEGRCAPSGWSRRWSLPFAALHQLCAPLLDRLERLPGPQRDALATTFGLSAGAAPDRFLVGLAVLEPALRGRRGAPASVRGRRRAVAGPGLGAGAGVRGAAAAGGVGGDAVRRPRAERGARGPAGAGGRGTRDADARALLASVIPGRLDERVADQIVAETRGNPLALLELPRGLSPARAGGRVRVAGGAVAPGADRGELPAAARGAAGRHAAAVAGGGGGADRRSGARCGARPSDSGSPARRSSRAEAPG